MIQPHDRLLFQGDSITNAFRLPKEINNAYQLGAGHVLMIASELLAKRPAWNLAFMNRGVSGEGVAQLLARWQADCIDLSPTVLTLLVGINDVNAFRAGKGREVSWFESHYRQLLDETKAALPATRLVLCEPFALPCGHYDDAGMAALAPRQRVVRDLAEEYGATYVPLQDRFNAAATKARMEYWIFDGVHPTAAGQRLIADAWMEAMGEREK